MHERAERRAERLVVHGGESVSPRDIGRRRCLRQREVDVRVELGADGVGLADDARQLVGALAGGRQRGVRRASPGRVDEAWVEP